MKEVGGGAAFCCGLTGVPWDAGGWLRSSATSLIFVLKLVSVYAHSLHSWQLHAHVVHFKGIDRPFELRGESRLIRSVIIAYIHGTELV